MSSTTPHDPNGWQLTDDEWQRLGWILAPAARAPGSQGGRPRLENDRDAARACLYRHFHELAPRYHCFGWNEIPEELGVSPSTANRRFREWTASGAWARFWDALMRLRRGGDPDPRQHEPLRPWKRRRQAGDFCPRQWRLGDRAVGHIALSAEALGRGAEAALVILLHEMVHLRNDQVGVVDCTPPYQYHNRAFRDAARLAGLDCPHRDPKRGYWATVLGPRGRQALAELRPREELFGWKVETGEGWG